MNILPLVFILLSVFALFAATGHQHLLQTALIQKEYRSYHQTDRTARKMAYLHAVEKKEKQKKAPSTPKTKNALEKGIVSKRDWKKLEARQGFNLAPLFHLDQAKLEQAKAGLFAWLDYLYRDCSFYNAEEIRAFFERLLVQGKDLPNLTSLEEFYLLDTNPSAAVFLLLQGTSVFDLEKATGIAPLGTFVTLAPGIKGVLQSKYTSLPLFNVLLGSEVVKKIEELERENAEKTHRHKSADFKDFKEYFVNNATLYDTILFWEELSSSATHARTVHRAQDPATGIRAQVESI